MSVIVSQFFCPAAGNDCPNTGFQVERTKGVQKGVTIEPGDFLLDSELENLLESGVQVVVGFIQK